MQIMPPTGLLFHGPSGCGKTLLAKALARALGINYLFVHVRAATSPTTHARVHMRTLVVYPLPHLSVVQCPMLLSKYVGDSEANVRDLFSTARGLAPCVLLLDEISSLGAARTREAATRGGTSVHERVLSTLLNELDGVGLKGVSGPPPYILTIGTASRHTDCDPALLRPGRLSLHVPLHLPDACDRMDIVRVLLAKADAVAAPDVL
ncbi:ATP-binding protein, partial [archaeon]